MSKNYDKEIQLIQNHLDQLGSIGSHPKHDYGVSIWKIPTISTLDRIFGNDSEKVNQLKDLSLRRSSIETSGIQAYDIDGFRKTAKGILDSAILELQNLGLSENKENGNGISLTFIQNQEQNQKVDAKIILEAFQSELTGTQLKELQEILEQEDKPEQKKEKILDKLASLGKDVATNIVANILANPTIWG